MPPGWDGVPTPPVWASALEQQALPGRLRSPGHCRNRSRSLTTADSCRDARWASVNNLGPRLHLILPGARRRDAGLAGQPLTPGRRGPTPDCRTGSFDSIGRAPWGPRSFSGRWSQRRARSSSRAPGDGQRSATIQNENEILRVGNGETTPPRGRDNRIPARRSRSGTLWRTWRNWQTRRAYPRSHTCPRSGPTRGAGRRAEGYLGLAPGNRVRVRLPASSTGDTILVHTRAYARSDVPGPEAEGYRA
jgi:hypothetical protein